MFVGADTPVCPANKISLPYKWANTSFRPYLGVNN